MKRIILSILAGLITGAILSTALDHVFHTVGVYPPYGEPMYDSGLLFMAFTYRAIFAIFGAYITAVVARDKAKISVLALGIIGTLLWLVGSIAMWEYAVPWYNIGGVLTAIPFALIGRGLYEQRSRRINA